MRWRSWWNKANLPVCGMSARAECTQRVTRASSTSCDKMNVWFIKKGSKTLACVSGTLLEISQSTAEGKTASEKPKPKKNRCFTCRKKIGLTGKCLPLGKLPCALSNPE